MFPVKIKFKDFFCLFLCMCYVLKDERRRFYAVLIAHSARRMHRARCLQNHHTTFPVRKCLCWPVAYITRCVSTSTRQSSHSMQTCSCRLTGFYPEDHA